jgi:hypothetical protein
MAFHYGFMHVPEQNASVEIGPLKCKGYKPKKDIWSGATCDTLKLIGQPSGYYITDQDNELKLE